MTTQQENHEEQDLPSMIESAKRLNEEIRKRRAELSTAAHAAAAKFYVQNINEITAAERLGADPMLIAYGLATRHDHHRPYLLALTTPGTEDGSWPDVISPCGNDDPPTGFDVPTFFVNAAVKTMFDGCDSRSIGAEVTKTLMRALDIAVSTTMSKSQPIIGDSMIPTNAEWESTIPVMRAATRHRAMRRMRAEHARAYSDRMGTPKQAAALAAQARRAKAEADRFAADHADALSALRSLGIQYGHSLADRHHDDLFMQILGAAAMIDDDANHGAPVIRRRLCSLPQSLADADGADRTYTFNLPLSAVDYDGEDYPYLRDVFYWPAIDATSITRHGLVSAFAYFDIMGLRIASARIRCASLTADSADGDGHVGETLTLLAALNADLESLLSSLADDAIYDDAAEGEGVLFELRNAESMNVVTVPR
jgi:hypothetical protein